MKNPNWNPREADKIFGKSPCQDCPNEMECNIMGLEMTCESLALADEKAFERMMGLNTWEGLEVEG